MSNSTLHEKFMQDDEYAQISNATHETPPIRHDAVLRAMVKAIADLVKTDMCVAASDFWIFNLTKTPPIWPMPAGRTESEVKKYGIRPFSYDKYKEFPSIIHVCVIGRGALTIDKVRVRIKGEWKPFVPWILSAPFRTMLLEQGERALRTQQIWWEKNGKHFPLLQLPPELRINVYEQVIGKDLYPRLEWNPKAKGLRGMLPIMGDGPKGKTISQI
jgi:hypothetical protein